MLRVEIIRFPKRNAYNDTIYIYVDDVLVGTYGGNSQPAGDDPLPRGRGMIATGTWTYKPGIHGISKPPSRRYPAFVQAKPILVVRADGKGGWSTTETSDYSFNMHRGGNNSVSSLGCITIPPAKWDEFHRFVIETLDRLDQNTFPITIRDSGKIAPTRGSVFASSKFNYFITRNNGNPSEATEPVRIPSVKETGGFGICPVRATIALTLDVDPKILEFEWKDDDLFFNGIKIETADVRDQENVTWGFLRDIIVATKVSAEIKGANVYIRATKSKVNED